jgi:hypothetical protein
LLAYWLLALAPIVAIVYLVWAHRRRTSAMVATRNERLERIFDAPASPAAPAAATGAAIEAPRPVAAPAPVAPPQLYAGKERLLGERHALLLAALRSAAPGHEVFAHVSLAALIEVAPTLQGREREQRLRALAQYVVDCVVCNADLRAIAAVDLEAGGTAEGQFKAECLKAAGVRYLRLPPTTLPKVENLRILIYSAAS